MYSAFNLYISENVAEKFEKVILESTRIGFSFYKSVHVFTQKVYLDLGRRLTTPSISRHSLTMIIAFPGK